MSTSLKDIAADIAWATKRAKEVIAERDALAGKLAEQDRVLRSSVPERWKWTVSPVDAVQSYIAELESLIRDIDCQVDIPYNSALVRRMTDIVRGDDPETVCPDCHGKGATAIDATGKEVPFCNCEEEARDRIRGIVREAGL